MLCYLSIPVGSHLPFCNYSMLGDKALTNTRAKKSERTEENVVKFISFKKVIKSCVQTQN